MMRRLNPAGAAELPAQSSRGRLWAPILLYHRVVPVLPQHDPYQICTTTATFERHLKWLAGRGYRSLSLEDVAALFDGRAKRPSLPPRAVAITFDDGYRDTYSYAWPLLRRYGFTATIFLVSDAIGGDNSFDAAYGSERAAMLSAEEIRELKRHGLHFGSHSCTHPVSLAELSDSQLRDELERSRSVIEGIVDEAVEHFAYPHCKLDDRVEAAVERAGYRLACAGVGTRFSPFCLDRVEPPARPKLNVEAHMQWRRLKWFVKNRLLQPDRARLTHEGMA